MKVIVLKEGIHEDIFVKGNKKIFWKIPQICGAIILLKAEKKGEKHIIVDTGNLGYGKEIIDALEKEGLKPEEVKYIINTHAHYDHLSNNYLFKNALRVEGNVLWYPFKSLAKFKKPINVPGIEIIATPGHTFPHKSVVVKSKGKTYVIAGDAIQEKYIKKRLYGIPSNQSYIESAKKIVDIADVIIPGHGRIIKGKDLEELKKSVYKMDLKS